MRLRIAQGYVLDRVIVMGSYAGISAAGKKGGVVCARDRAQKNTRSSGQDADRCFIGGAHVESPS
jgi:hypothetical protein